MRTIELLQYIREVKEVDTLDLSPEDKLSILTEIQANIPSPRRYPQSTKTLAVLATELAKVISKYQTPKPKKVSTDEQPAKPKRTTRRKAPAKAKAVQSKPD